MSTDSTTRDATRWDRLVDLLPWMWLGLSAAWVVVILVTDQVAWPLAVWIATTVGPLTLLKTRLDRTATPEGTTNDHHDSRA